VHGIKGVPLSEYNFRGWQGAASYLKERRHNFIKTYLANTFFENTSLTLFTEPTALQIATNNVLQSPIILLTQTNISH
jgi:hypothetical protein